MNNLVAPIIFFLCFPYLGFWNFFGLGTQPNFIICFLILIAFKRVNLLISVCLLAFLLTFFEQSSSVFLREKFQIVRFDLIIIMVASITYKNFAEDFLKLSRDAFGINFILTFMFFLLFLMLFFSIKSTVYASDLNYFFTGFPQYFEGLRVSYYAPEPGLSAFGIMTWYILFVTFQVKKSTVLNLCVLASVLFLLLSTSSLTGIVLSIFAVYIYVIVNKVSVLWVLASFVFFAVFLIIFEPVAFDHPLDRINQLFNLSENPDGSPALRIDNIMYFFNNFFDIYIDFDNEKPMAVGFTSYLAILPISTAWFLAYHLIKRNFTSIIFLMFAVVLLPTTNPFIFSIILFERLVALNGPIFRFRLIKSP